MVIQTTVTEREKEIANIQKAVKRFFKQGGTAKVLPAPTFKPMPLRKDARPGYRPKPAPISSRASKAKQSALQAEATCAQQQAWEEQAALIERIRLHDGFRHLEESVIEAVLTMSAKKLSPRQISYRMKLGTGVVNSILEYHAQESARSATEQQVCA